MENQSRPGGKHRNEQLVQNQRPGTTIRFQLLIVVNSALAVFVVAFLIFEYRRDLAERLEEKQISLEEEAKTLLPAILQMRHRGTDGVQRYIDAVCTQMQESHSPGHHIAVEVENDAFQATAHHRASPQILQAMRQAANAPSNRSGHGPSELVVGMYRYGNVTVYVSETMQNLHRSVVDDVMRRLTGFVLLAVVAAIVVNFALFRIVTRPLNELVTTVQRIGNGQLGVQSRSFHNRELNYLADEINFMSQALAATENARRAQMNKAREIQQNLLPKEVEIPGLSVAHLFQPADDVGGDYYDTLPLSDGTWLVCVADVTGHGVSAALSAAMLKTLLMQAVDLSTSPAALLALVNRRFTAVSLVGDFVSMLLVRVNPRTSVVEYASAGHEPAWVLSPSAAKQELSSTGILLGIEDDPTWEDVTLHMAPGHRMVLVTDGVSETESPDGEMFGRTLLADLVTDCRHLPLAQTVERINESLTIFRDATPQHDDVTIVLIEFSNDAQ